MTEEIITRLDKMNDLLEKIAQNRGHLGPENEQKVLEHLRENGTINKQQIIGLLKVSSTTAYNIMKRLESDKIMYIAGSGRRQSVLIYAEEGSLEARMAEIIRTIPPRTIITIEEYMKVHGMKKEDVRKLFIKVKNFCSDFFMESGNLIRKG